MKPRFRSVVFDVDSTLSALEGIDWLAALRGPEVAAESEALTARAMAGELPIEAVYTHRLARIRPTAAELAALGTAYVDRVQPGARELIAALHAAGTRVYLVSGGLRAAILPLASHLGVAPIRVHAVELAPDADGTLSLLDGEQPLATQRGKPHIVRYLALQPPIAMIGDGSTDAAVRTVTDVTFIAYTGVAVRPHVVAQAALQADSCVALAAHLFDDPDH